MYPWRLSLAQPPPSACLLSQSKFSPIQYPLRYFLLVMSVCQQCHSSVMQQRYVTSVAASECPPSTVRVGRRTCAQHGHYGCRTCRRPAANLFKRTTKLCFPDSQRIVHILRAHLLDDGVEYSSNSGIVRYRATPSHACHFRKLSMPIFKPLVVAKEGRPMLSL